MAVIVFGKGFIGSRLHAVLAADGLQAAAFDSKSVDLLDPLAVRAVCACGPHAAIIITAAITRLRANDFASFQANIQMVQNIIGALAETPPAQLLFLSTIDVYGLVDGADKITEASPLRPDDYYALSKVVAEFLLEKFSRASGCPLLVLRLPGVYGPGADPRTTLHRMVQAAAAQRCIQVMSGGALLRDFLYIEDLCRVVKFALAHKVSGIYNVAGGLSFSITEIAEMIADLWPFPVEIRRVAGCDGPPRAGSLVFDTTRLRKGFEGVVFTPLAEGLRAYAAAWMAEGERGI